MSPEPPYPCLETGVPLQMLGHSSWDSRSPSAPGAWIGFQWPITFQLLKFSAHSADWRPWGPRKLQSVCRSGLGWGPGHRGSRHLLGLVPPKPLVAPHVLSIPSLGGGFFGLTLKSEMRARSTGWGLVDIPTLSPGHEVQCLFGRGDAQDVGSHEWLRRDQA